ncbi:MAG: hypothetical protein CMA88_00485 [Euryarchaeota archaeon]|nr:hypothetical protein [Euryarchaeota archaeon]
MSDSAPDIDPRLSRGATKLRKRKLDNLPWDHSGRHPGSPIFWHLITFMNQISWRYIFRRRQIDNLPDYDGGRILCAMHLNGLVDPMTLTHAQDRRVISMGRHDLMTMPLIGWFARRMGSQPVIRRPEIESGVSDQNYAKEINDRTLLTMTNCIASGHNAIVMPEGKSHQDSRLHRFKTGPMRFALNAASIAEKRGVTKPALQPVGLHYRCHFWFRTDVFVEFAAPIPISAPDDPELWNRLSSGTWVEPPAEQVNLLRDELFEAVSEVTPNAPDWDTHRAWHLIGHLRAQENGEALGSLREEVLAARDVRDSLSERGGAEGIMEPSTKAARILHSNDLDARSIIDGQISHGRLWSKGLLGLVIMVAASPVTIPSTGFQAFLAWFLGDRTDEGIDARTTYHMLAAMFSPILFWPPLAVLASTLISPISFLTIPISLSIMVGIHLTNILFLFGYDLWTDFADSVRRTKLACSEQGKSLEKLVEETRSYLNLL